jgi:hypothetical protein
MKKILFILVTFLTVNLFAQPPGGARRKQGQKPKTDQTKKIKKFSSSDVAGVFYYDIEKVIKKLKVKNEKKKYSIEKALKNYNFKVKEISFLNSEKFTDFDLVLDAASKTNDRKGTMAMRKKVVEVIRPIRDSIYANEKELNKTLENLLSEKQQKKWLKHQKKKKQSLQPPRPQNKNSKNSKPNSRTSRRQ